MDFERKMDAKLILSIVAAGLLSFCGVLEETAMNITFPTLMKEFSIGTSTVQWITTGYLLVLSICVPSSAYISKRFKMKSTFITAVSLFIIGTFMAALAPAFAFLLLGRLIQGVGTGMALPLMFNIIITQAPEDKMGLLMGIALMITGVAPAIGPTLGGTMIARFSWRAIFVCLLPLLFFSFICGSLCIRQSTKLSHPKFDFVGYLFLALAFVCLILGSSNASSGWLSLKVLGLLAGAIVFLALFVIKSLKTPSPVIHPRVFTSPQFTFSLITFVVTIFLTLGLGFLIPNYVQLTLHQSALTSGLVMLPGAICCMIVLPLAGKLYDRFGVKGNLIVASLLLIIAQLGFYFGISKATLLSVLITYMFFGIGQGFNIGTDMTYGLAALKEEEQADGNAIFNTMQQLFGAIGTSVVSSIVALAQNGHVNAANTAIGTAHGYLLLLVLAFIGAFFAMLNITRKH